MNLKQLFLILQARYRLVLIALFGTLFVAFVITLMMPNRYKATASVVVDVKSPDPVAGMALPAMTLPGYMATQVDIINSDRVAYGVIKRLGFDKSPELQERWRDKTDGKGTFEAWYGDFLRSQLEVKPSRESNVINITFKAQDPKYAATIANAYSQAYIDTNIELRADTARQYAIWFDQQAKLLRERLKQAQTKLSEYQQQNGIVASDQRIDAENRQLNELQTQLILAESSNVDASSKQKTGSIDSGQEVMQSPIIQQLKTEIAMQEARLQELAGRIGVNHPQYQAMLSQIAVLKQKQGAETGRIRSSIDTTRRVSSEKVAALNAAIEAHKKSILSMRTQTDEAIVLQKEVDSAQKAYDVVSERFNQSNLESKATQANISVLTPAVEPLHPASPRLLLNLAAAALVGLVLGIAAAVIAELRDRRIRSYDDIQTGLSLPVLATVLPQMEMTPYRALTRSGMLARLGMRPQTATNMGGIEP